MWLQATLILFVLDYMGQEFQSGGSSGSSDVGWDHSIGCIGLLPVLGWQVLEGSIHRSGTWASLIKATLSHLLLWAASQHGGGRRAGVLRWCLASKRES